MPRSRSIKPAFFKNEVLAAMDPHTRLLFAGLWTLADREGRLEDRPARVRAEVFPYEAIDVDAALCALEREGFIQRYEAHGGKFIQITNFGKHQTPHVKEQASTIPAPCLPGACTSDSLNLTPDSLNPEPVTPDTGHDMDPAFDQDAAFEGLWQHYPNKDGRKAALRHFRASVRSTADLVRIRDALRNYLASDRVQKGFVKNGSTWFNGWQDWENYTEAPHAADNGARNQGGAGRSGVLPGSIDRVARAAELIVARRRAESGRG